MYRNGLGSGMLEAWSQIHILLFNSRQDIPLLCLKLPCLLNGDSKSSSLLGLWLNEVITQSVWYRIWHLAAFNTFAAISINLSLNCIPVPWCCVPGRGEKGEDIYWG